MVDKKTEGKKNRAAGKAFEIKVRAFLENKGWTIDRWTNNIDLETGKLIPAKPKFIFNPIIKRRIPIGMSSGFPDFIAFRKIMIGDTGISSYEIIGVEAKIKGYLDKEEKTKSRWLIENYIFSSILIAKKGEKRGEIILTEF